MSLLEEQLCYEDREWFRNWICNEIPQFCDELGCFSAAQRCRPRPEFINRSAGSRHYWVSRSGDKWFERVKVEAGKTTDLGEARAKKPMEE